MTGLGAALFFGVTYVARLQRSEINAMIPASPALQHPSDRQYQATFALASAQNETAVAEHPAVPHPAPAADTEYVPVFDIARIESSGEAVIAGRTAPHARVELLRDGEPYEHTVSDPSGQFVMVSLRLPTGRYELTLRSTLSDGRLMVSTQNVMVALQPNGKGPPIPAITPDAAAAIASQSRSSEILTPDTVASVAPHEGAAKPPSGEDSPSSATGSNATAIVSRGDSLWRISRSIYGSGNRYAVIYGANRHRIRNPNRIYPGQVFILPDAGQ